MRDDHESIERRVEHRRLMEISGKAADAVARMETITGEPRNGFQRLRQRFNRWILWKIQQREEEARVAARETYRVE